MLKMEKVYQKQREEIIEVCATMEKEKIILNKNHFTQLFYWRQKEWAYCPIGKVSMKMI